MPMPVVTPSTYPAERDDLPDWLPGLKGYNAIVPQLRDSAAGDRRKASAWQVSMALPVDAASAANDIDPLVMLTMLAYGRARTEDKISEVVRVCRDNGKSWTKIGQILGVSKQAAWERYSGED
jgi:hypothetical protein